MKQVIITGAMGFIGSHTAKLFKQHGYYVIGIDREETIPSAAQYLDQWLRDDYVTMTPVAAVENDVWNIIHCAGTSLVGPSITDPHTYYSNNSHGTNELLQELHDRDWHGHITFSSSAATYGLPLHGRPLVENDEQIPINPYGWSKLFCEQIIKDHCRAHGFSAILFRYFNACGADPDGSLGHVAEDSHLIPQILSAHQLGKKFTLYGSNYKTHDGTCIRDYLHVMDIAAAHLEAVRLGEGMRSGECTAYNLGTGTGHSVGDVVKMCGQVVGSKIRYRVSDPRPGDPDELVASSLKFQRNSNWRPKYDLENMVNTAWQWQQKL